MGELKRLAAQLLSELLPGPEWEMAFIKWPGSDLMIVMTHPDHSPILLKAKDRKATP